MRHNFRNIIGILGLLILLNGVFMLLSLPFTIYYGEDWKPTTISTIIVLIAGSIAWGLNYRQNKEIKKRDGYLIVTFGWIFMSLSGCLPFILSGTIPSFTDAFFETMSGYTTTGASILTDIESMPKGLLFWRSMTQWIGGMGIIVLTVAILPILGIGGMQLFIAEVPGISADKLKPRIRETAKRLWLVYVALTLAETILLLAGGMNFFDAINHSLTSMATGGFSTKNDSIAHFDSPFIHYTIILFMFIAGTSFNLNYFIFKGQFNRLIKNEEFKVYGLIILISSLLIGILLIRYTDTNIELAFREALFQVTAIVTTTGFVTADYSSWSLFIVLLIFALMFIGGSAGSTAGGIKVIRHMVLFKNAFLEIKRQLYPAAIVPVRINKRAITQDTTFHVLAFIILYFLLFAIGCIMMAAVGMDFQTSMGAVATSIGNIGPGLGMVGPVNNFSWVPDTGKWILAFYMLLGRLELFTVLMLLTPYYWKNQ